MEMLGYVGKERDLLDPEAQLDRIEALNDDPTERLQVERVFERPCKEWCV